MEKRKSKNFPKTGFTERFGSMLRLDLRRMRVAPLFYVCLLIAFAVPILILVMTTLAGGEGTGLAFANTWQIIGSESGNMAAMMGSAMGGGEASSGAGMDMTAMMNINLVFMLTGVFLCLFVSEDFRSGYSKNLFTVRAGKTDYVASKTVIGFIAGTLFLLAFLFGGILGGSFAGLSFALGAAGISGLVMSMLAKIFLMGVFVAIFLLMCVIARHRAWMSILLSLFGGMLLFMMIPMLTPLDSGVINVGMCLAGGAIFSVAIGAVSNVVLKRSSLVS